MPDKRQVLKTLQGALAANEKLRRALASDQVAPWVPRGRKVKLLKMAG
jgi:hypothetical protein